MSRPAQLVVGTAGHIDHGKSRLIHALTGTDPDRLPEEQARGMTIDLGFAHARIDGCDVWFVDVPGHERFIRNMVAGATGIDAALLVVAADDSVMPQTHEHAELLSLLGIDRCIVTLTKMDLVDDEWAAAVEEEVGELLARLGIEPLAVVHTSARTGRGLDELRTHLAALARRAATSADGPRWFMLPIDRAFNVPGRGTVVTGSVRHGQIQRDQELELWPGGRRVRVRDLQTHSEDVATAGGRMRLALNLAGVPLDQVGRGMTLASPGYLADGRFFDVWLASLRVLGKSPRRAMRLRLHAATSDVLAELFLYQKPEQRELRDVPARVATAEPIAVEWGQRFILRDESGSRNVGGGQFLRPAHSRSTRGEPDRAARFNRLRLGTPLERLEEVIRAAAWEETTPARLAAWAGLPDEDEARRGCSQLASRGRVRTFDLASHPVVIHNDLLDQTAGFLAHRLSQHLAANPRLPGISRSEWPGWMPRACPARLRQVLADFLVRSSRFKLAGGFVVPADHAAAISDEDRELLDAILRELDSAAFQPPQPVELACTTPRNARRVIELVDLAAARGQLVRIADGIWLHARHWNALLEKLSATLRDGAALGVADLKNLTQSTRKYVVPLAEYLDAQQITRRVGDRRVAGPRLAEVSKAPAS